MKINLLKHPEKIGKTVNVVKRITLNNNNNKYYSSMSAMAS